MQRFREGGDFVDVVVIVPEPGRAKEIGRRLLAIAESPYQVRWVTYPEAGFEVPAEFLLLLDGPDRGDTDGALNPPLEPRRRGRPRRQPVEDVIADNEETLEEV